MFSSNIIIANSIFFIHISYIRVVRFFYFIIHNDGSQFFRRVLISWVRNCFRISFWKKLNFMCRHAPFRVHSVLGVTTFFGISGFETIRKSGDTTNFRKINAIIIKLFVNVWKFFFPFNLADSSTCKLLIKFEWILHQNCVVWAQPFNRIENVWK